LASPITSRSKPAISPREDGDEVVELRVGQRPVDDAVALRDLTVDRLGARDELQRTAAADERRQPRDRAGPGADGMSAMRDRSYGWRKWSGSALSNTTTVTRTSPRSIYSVSRSAASWRRRWR
jgi:hypothetical protein